MRIGIDLGGTKIEGIALDGSAEVARLRVDTPRGDYAATVDAVAALVSALEKRAGTGGSVGVGIPGTLSPENGLVKNANSVWLIGQPLQADLERALGRAVRIANDANCFAVSEAADGAGAGAEVVFGVIVGTGTGAGIVVRGELLTGANAIAGEWGHNPLPSPTDDERPDLRAIAADAGASRRSCQGPPSRRITSVQRELGLRRPRSSRLQAPAIARRRRRSSGTSRGWRAHWPASSTSSTLT